MLSPQSFQFVGAGQYAGAFGHAAAGHGAAPVDELAVQRDDAEAVLVLSRHGDAAVQILRYHRAAQQIPENIVIFCIVSDQPGGHAHKSRFVLHTPLPQFVAADGGQRQEGGPSAVPLFQELDGGFGVLLPVHYDVLHPGAQGDLQRYGIFAVGLHQICHRPADAPQHIPVRGLHDHPDSFAEALVFLLHLRKHPDS